MTIFGRKFTTIELFIIISLLGIIPAMIIGSNDQAITTIEKSAEQKDKEQKEASRAIAGATILRNAMRDPDSFKLESVRVIEGSGAVCYRYRSRNGFGGMNSGQGVLPSNKDNIIASEMPGFIKAWNKECANKKGTDYLAMTELILPRM